MSLDAGRHPTDVAPDLLGWSIACRGTAAVLTEVEAYHQEEPAAHSYGGRPTPRSAGLFGPPGTAYVYLSYGMHWCANLVTGPDGSGEAVLLRSAVPAFGIDEMVGRRRRSTDLLTGPGRLAQALDIRHEDTGRQMLREDLGSLDEALAAAVDGPVIWRDDELAASVGIELPVTADRLLVGPRIGITKAVDLPWRFGVAGVRLSKPFRA